MIERIENISKIDAKGRNGYFTLNEISIFETSPRNGLDQECFVDFFGKRRGKSAPLRFTGPREALLAMFEQVVAKLKNSENDEAQDVEIDLRLACQAVVDSWESGDLAAAVRQCSDALDVANEASGKVV